MAVLYLRLLPLYQLISTCTNNLVQLGTNCYLWLLVGTIWYQILEIAIFFYFLSGTLWSYQKQNFKVNITLMFYYIIIFKYPDFFERKNISAKNLKFFFFFNLNFKF